MLIVYSRINPAFRPGICIYGCTKLLSPVYSTKVQVQPGYFTSIPSFATTSYHHVQLLSYSFCTHYPSFKTKPTAALLVFLTQKFKHILQHQPWPTTPSAPDPNAETAVMNQTHGDIHRRKIPSMHHMCLHHQHLYTTNTQNMCPRRFPF
jgi:hypothetical protein